jgi:hypothetical protein
MGTPVIAGRDFFLGSAPKVAIVNDVRSQVLRWG